MTTLLLLSAPTIVAGAVVGIVYALRLATGKRREL